MVQQSPIRIDSSSLPAVRAAAGVYGLTLTRFVTKILSEESKRILDEFARGRLDGEMDTSRSPGK